MVKKWIADDRSGTNARPPDGEIFFFEIRKGADADNVGEVIAEAYHFEADLVIERTQVGGTDPVTGEADFRCVSTDLAECENLIVDDFGTSPTPTLDDEVQAKMPAGDYQFCESNVMPGWESSVRDFADAFPLPVVNVAFFVPNQNDPLVDNSVYCAGFTLGIGNDVLFEVYDVPPPGGDARTIGFWKNWSGEFSGGNQDNVLGATIDASPLGGFFEGVLFVDNEQDAIYVMSKQALDKKHKKHANDAAYNLASQHLAAQLNIVAGARTCDALTDTVDAAQLLLNDVGFDGTGNYLVSGKKKGTGSAADIEYALDLAGQLDSYNNNEGISFDGGDVECLP
jgi:hypothetical protein